MQYILLPGFSLQNKEWTKEFIAEMQKRGIKVDVLEWEHWTTGNPADWNLDQEVERLSELVKEEEFCIVAKSIGTLVALMFIEQTQKIPSKLIFLGLPLHDIGDEDKAVYQQVLSRYPNINLSVIQNENDNHGSYKEVEKFLHEIRPDLEIIKTTRSDHHYPFYDLIYEFLTI